MQYLPAVEGCCDKHDKCYDTCNKMKESCDDDFRSCLRRICKRNSNVLKEANDGKWTRSHNGALVHFRCEHAAGLCSIYFCIYGKWLELRFREDDQYIWTGYNYLTQHLPPSAKVLCHVAEYYEVSDWTDPWNKKAAFLKSFDCICSSAWQNWDHWMAQFTITHSFLPEILESSSTFEQCYVHTSASLSCIILK